MKLWRFLSVGLLALAFGAGASFWLQRETAEELRAEVTELRRAKSVLQRTRIEHERLVAVQVTEAELARLREDHAAVARLRKEVEQLREDLHIQDMKLRDKIVAVPGAVTISVGTGINGELLLDGGPFDMDKLRQRLATLPKGSKVDINFRLSGVQDPEVASENARRSMKEVGAVAREAGMYAVFRMDALNRQEPPANAVVK